MYELTEAEKAACLQEARRELGLLPEPPEGWVEIFYEPPNNQVEIWYDAPTDVRKELGAPPNATALVTEDAWELVWKPKGWKRVLYP